MIRLYNSALSFTYCSAQIDDTLIRNTKGVYTFRINGSMHHQMPPIRPDDQTKPRFAQVYTYDPSFQAHYRNGMFPDLSKSIIEVLQSIIIENNPYAKLFKQVGQSIVSNPKQEYQIVLKSNVSKDKTLNLPTTDEVATLIVAPSCTNSNKSMNIMIKDRADNMRFITHHSGAYDPLHYVLMFPFGQQGWEPNRIEYASSRPEENDICVVPETTMAGEALEDFGTVEDTEDLSTEEEIVVAKSKKRTHVTALQYYCYQLQQRESMN